jgi:hypothetical protein
MDKHQRLRLLEWRLDNEDLSDEEFRRVNKEYNDIQDEMEAFNVDAKNRRLEERKRLAESDELAKILTLTEDEVDRMYEKACIDTQDVNGMSFKAWYEQSQKYYTIDESYNVHARARSSNTVEVVPHPTLAQAKLTILNRIKYKFYDHAVRGHDFAYELE